MKLIGEVWREQLNKFVSGIFAHLNLIYVVTSERYVMVDIDLVSGEHFVQPKKWEVM